MQLRTVCRLAAFLLCAAVAKLASAADLQARRADLQTHRCDGLPQFVYMGSDFCPPRIAGFCIVDGKACPALDAERLRSAARVTVGNVEWCRRFLHERPEHIAFDLQHHLSLDTAMTYLFGAPNGFAGTLDMGQGVARVDANNDGVLDYIAPFRVSGGRHCDTMRFMPLNQALSAPINSSLAPALERLNECPGTLPVKLNDTIYFESRSGSVGNYGTKFQLLWQVYILRGSEAHKLCEFRYRWPKGMKHES